MTVIKVNRPHDQSLIQEVPLMDAQALENIISKAQSVVFKFRTLVACL